MEPRLRRIPAIRSRRSISPDVGRKIRGINRLVSSVGRRWSGCRRGIEENAQEVRRAALRFASENPDLVADIEDLEVLLRLFDGNADLAGDADRIAAVIDG